MAFGGGEEGVFELVVSFKGLSRALGGPFFLQRAAPDDAETKLKIAEEMTQAPTREPRALTTGCLRRRRRWRVAPKSEPESPTARYAERRGQWPVQQSSHAPGTLLRVKQPPHSDSKYYPPTVPRRLLTQHQQVVAPKTERDNNFFQGGAGIPKETALELVKQVGERKTPYSEGRSPYHQPESILEFSSSRSSLWTSGGQTGQDAAQISPLVITPASGKQQPPASAPVVLSGKQVRRRAAAGRRRPPASAPVAGRSRFFAPHGVVSNGTTTSPASESVAVKLSDQPTSTTHPSPNCCR
jgi:hypothetical protein